LRKLLSLAILAVLLLGIDQGARALAEGKLASRARQAAGSQASAEATIASFPFLVRLLTSGSVPRVEVRVNNARAGVLRLSAVDVRATHSGPRWSLLAACVLALASVWGVARIFNDTPQELVSPAPNVVDSAGLASGARTDHRATSSLAPVEVRAVGASPQVVVRDRGGRILWAGKLAQGQRQQVIGLAPFDVTASNGGAVKISLLGKPKGSVGESSAAASRQVG